MQKSYEWNSQVKRGQQVDSAGVNNSIADILRSKLTEEINAQMKRIIENFESKEMPTVKATLSVKSLEKKTTTITHTYTESYTVSRPPEGLWENVRHFFGKEYYRTEHSTRTEHQTVDLGTNLDEFVESLMPQVEKFAHTQAEVSLADLRDKYFATRETFAANMQLEINKLRAELNALKL